MRRLTKWFFDLDIFCIHGRLTNSDLVLRPDTERIKFILLEASDCELCVWYVVLVGTEPFICALQLVLDHVIKDGRSAIVFWWTPVEVYAVVGDIAEFGDARTSRKVCNKMG